MNLWMDDLRPAPVGWTWVKTVAEARALLLTGEVEHASFDHDLGYPPPDDGSGLAIWMAENSVWPKYRPTCHSSNPIGRAYMLGVFERYGPWR